MLASSSTLLLLTAATTTTLSFLLPAFAESSFSTTLLLEPTSSSSTPLLCSSSSSSSSTSSRNPRTRWYPKPRNTNRDHDHDRRRRPRSVTSSQNGYHAPIPPIIPIIQPWSDHDYDSVRSQAHNAVIDPGSAESENHFFKQDKRSTLSFSSAAAEAATISNSQQRAFHSYLSLSPSNSGIFILPLSLGNPPRSYRFQIDLASSDLVLTSTKCTLSSCPHLPWSSSSSKLYNPDVSQSFSSISNNSTHFNLTFSDNSFASGFLAREDLTLPLVSTSGNASISKIRGQSFGVVGESNIDWGGQGISGIIGLGFPRGSQLVRVGLDQVLVQSGASETATTTTTMTTTGLGVATGMTSAVQVQVIPSSSASASKSSTNPSYYPPFLQTLFSSPNSSSSSSPSTELAYPVIGLALSNSSDPYSTRTSNASITLGGVSAEYVDEESREKIDWYKVVPFGEAVLYASTSAFSSASAAAAADADVNKIQSEADEITTLEQEEYLYWAIQLRSVTMNGSAIVLTPTYNASYTGLSGGAAPSGGPSIALLDVGTNGIYAPESDVVNLFSKVKNARLVSENQYAVPCDTQMTMTFQFGADEGGRRRIITLQPSEWMIGRASGTTSMCLAWPMISPPGADGIDWQLGTPFLKKTYTVFSYGFNGGQAPLVGFLPLPGSTSTATATTTMATTTTANANAAASLSSGNISSATTTNNPATPTSVQSPEEISSYLTITIGTTLPNVILPRPTYSTPLYAFQTTSIPTLGTPQSTGLANNSIYTVSAVPIFPVSPVSVSAGTTKGTNGKTGSGVGVDGSPGAGSGAMASIEFPPVIHLVFALVIAILIGFGFA